MSPLQTRTVMFTLALATTLLGGVAFGKSFFQFKVPHGAVIGCPTCHISIAAPPSWNPFGLDVKATMVASQPDWAAICGIDSDGDGFTNGEELLDPDCLWPGGGASPGDTADVTHPGDPDDSPPEPEPDVIIEADVEEPSEDAGPEPDSEEAPEGDAESTVEDVEAPEADVEAPEADVEAPEADVEAPEADVEAPEADVEAPPEDTGPSSEDVTNDDAAPDSGLEPADGGVDDSQSTAPTGCEEGAGECPDGTTCIAGACEATDAGGAPGDDSPNDTTDPLDNDDTSEVPPSSDDDGGCQGGAPSPGLFGLFGLGVAVILRRRMTLSL
jgi:hypothetical protein